jgi:hypothetical protein
MRVPNGHGTPDAECEGFIFVNMDLDRNESVPVGELRWLDQARVTVLMYPL